MTNENQFQDSTYFFLTLSKYKRFLIIFTLLGAVGSTIVALLLPKWYASSTNLVPSNSSQDNSSVAGSAISSTLKEFGLTKMTGSGSQDQYSYIVILQSRSVVDSIINKYELHKVYDIPKKDMIDLRKAFLNNVEINYEKEGNYIITVWDIDRNRAANIANDYVQIANNHFLDLFRQDNKLSKDYFELRIQTIDSILISLGNKLNKFSKQTQLFSPEDQAQSVAKALAEMKAEQVKYEIYYNFYKTNYGENDAMAQSYKNIGAEITDKLNSLQTQPGFAGNFSLSEASSVGLEYLKLYTEFEAYTKVKAMILSMMEKIRTDEIKNIQNLLVVDKAVPSDKKDKPKRAFVIAGSTFGMFILGVLIIFFINYFKEISTQIKLYRNDQSK
jgi:uncharacterized protein involved in exopolysaccharide biosynthesis